VHLILTGLRPHPDNVEAERRTPIAEGRAVAIPSARAKLTAAMTSSVEWQRAIRLGRLSIIPFQVFRCCS
jgi:hypothetical protein